jgi:hypothetical protein
MRRSKSSDSGRLAPASTMPLTEHPVRRARRAVRRRIGMAIAAVAALLVPLLSATPASATSTAEDGADTFSVASGTAVMFSSSKVIISVPGSSPSMVITCTSSTFSGKTKSSLRFPTGLPVLTDAGNASCTDSLGFTDSFAANSVNGSWAVAEKDFTNAGAGDEGLPEPNATGDKFMIHMPKAGLIDTNNWPCTLTFAPSGNASISGAYNDAGTFSVKNAKIPIGMSGPAFCGPASQTVTLTATYTLNPGIFDKG